MLILGASVAQLVEHHLAKVDVVGSNPIARSIHGALFILNKPIKNESIAKRQQTFFR